MLTCAIYNIDPETVGKCAQVFFIAKSQKGALELALADPSEEDWDDATATRSVIALFFIALNLMASITPE